MPNLLALCKPQDAPVAVKRVQITQPVQDIINGLFQQQAIAFLDGIHEEIPFGGDYKPDADEVLVLEAPEEIAVMRAAIANPIGLDIVQAANFLNENIKGLFTSVNDAPNSRIMIQSFTAQQILARNFVALILDGNTFRQVTEPSFTLDNKLVAIVEDDKLKFKSFNLIKRIFSLAEVYREATDQQIDAFCAHASLSVDDVQAFKAVADQVIRKLVHAVGSSNILTQCSVDEMQNKAAALGVEIVVQNGKIVMPAGKQQIKYILRFLDESIYEGPLSARRMIASGKRIFPVGG